LVDATHGACHRGRVADVAANELDLALDLGEPPRRAPGIVVEHPQRLALLQQRLDQRRADEAGAAGHQDAPRAHVRPSPPVAVGGEPRIKCPPPWARRAASIRHCTRYPSAKPGAGLPPATQASMKRPTSRPTGTTRTSASSAAPKSSTGTVCSAASPRRACCS